jgi:hypothetical protein
MVKSMKTECKKKIAEIFRPNTRFFRSVNVERDFSDPRALENYILTSHALECFERISAGFREKSTQRAWRITGDYGSGKSSFALLLAKFMAGDRQDVPPQIFSTLSEPPKISVDNIRYYPLLVTGFRGSLSLALIKTLYAHLEKIDFRGAKSSDCHRLKDHLHAQKNIPDDELIEIFNRVKTLLIAEKNYTGILLIIDEMGKFLEYAALYPQHQDLYLLQQLAEMAARSGETPFFVVSFLHQGFNAYSGQLSLATQREWQKIAGRFDEIPFNQPLDQVGLLINKALNSHATPDNLGQEIQQKISTSLKKIIQLGWYGASSLAPSLEENAWGHYPLHPSVVPVLVRFFHRFAQNERSLFSFLLGNESGGLQTFAQTQECSESTFYRLSHLFDYVKVNFGRQMAMQNGRIHWSQLESIVDAYQTNDDLEKNIVKTIGLLNLLHSDDLACTAEALSVAVGNAGNKEHIFSLLEKLQAQGIIHSRGTKAGYFLWPHLSIDLHQACEKAEKAVGKIENVAEFLRERLDSTPLVARRHYIQTGNLRYFSIRYCGIDEFLATSATELIQGIASQCADGLVIIPLCESGLEVQKAREYALTQDFLGNPQIIIAIPQPLQSLSSLLQDVSQWDWIAANIPELHADRFASVEVARKRSSAQLALEKHVKNFVNLKNFSPDSGMLIFQEGRPKDIRSGKEFVGLLSETCDVLFSQAPLLKNELINRRNLSSAAAAARMRLIERIFQYADKPLLGMDSTKKPPEMSMYLSVLKNGDLHSEESGLHLPSPEHDACRLIPVFTFLSTELETNKDKRLRVADVFRKLKTGEGL